MLPLLGVSFHAKADGPKSPEQASKSNVEHCVCGPLQVFAPISRRPVNTEASGEDCKVERGIVVMDVCNTGHSDKGEVVEEPANHWVDASIVNLVDAVL